MADGHREERQAEGLLTVAEVAERLRLKEAYVYEMARRGEIPCVRTGKYVRIRESTVREWIARNEQKALDRSIYTEYTSSRSGRNCGRRGAASNPKSSGAHAGGNGRAARRHVQHGRPARAERGEDHGADVAADSADSRTGPDASGTAKRE